jgi:hypothetical protein
MKDQKNIDRENELKKLSEIVANWINANALVNDDWVNALKTYHNVEITKEDMGRMYMLVMCMYIELLLARLEDLLEPRERISFDKAVIEHISYINSLINFKAKDNDFTEEKAKTTMENSFYELLKIYRTNRQQQNLTIPNNYLAYLVHSSQGYKLSEEIWTEYINSHVGKFEERNFRNQLIIILGRINAINT